MRNVSRKQRRLANVRHSVNAYVNTRAIFTTLGVAIISSVIVPNVARAHAVVFPRTSMPGAYEKYVLRVPNEKDVPTTRVEIRFPADVRVVLALVSLGLVLRKPDSLTGERSTSL